ncbi:MAG: single-stranded DNA-binding protein [Bacteroidales bacterium]
MSLNKVLLIGNVGKDPEVRHLENGSMVARFSLATTEKFKDKNGEFQEQTEWHNVVCWRSLAERVEKYVKKGSQLFIEGKIRTGSWEDKTGQIRYTVEIIADNIQILGKKQDSQGVSPDRNNIQDIVPPAGASALGIDDDSDLPF